MRSNTEVKKVYSGSLAEEAGIEPGDRLLSINGRNISDVFDYRFLAAEENLLLEILKASGEVWELEIEKDEYEDIGIDFETPMMDEARCCSNKCVFCFIDQLPEGMRPTLYFKDDDSRLSFLSGNYVTLTNIKNEELDRIIGYRMSPINVSVHTTNPVLRRSMLGNRLAGDVLRKIEKLVQGGIEVNCQIVLCRGINDGKELENTLGDLSALRPPIRSISVVPVGLTRHRKGLKPLEPFDGEAAGEVIGQIERWQRRLLKNAGSRLVYPADEFYILAGLDIPHHEVYEDFPQIENGVGLLALFRQEFRERLKSLEEERPKSPENQAFRTVSIATGVSPARHIRAFSEELEKLMGGRLTVKVYEIRNDFFGQNVTVTGLLTGQDLVLQLRGKELGKELLISRSMLKAGEELFLDDYTVERLSRELGVRVTVVENDGADFANKILGGCRQL